jgi:hypothetical protein
MNVYKYRVGCRVPDGCKRADSFGAEGYVLCENFAAALRFANTAVEKAAAKWREPLDAFSVAEVSLHIANIEAG